MSSGDEAEHGRQALAGGQVLSLKEKFNLS
jgi:hypothetical protein